MTTISETHTDDPFQLTLDKILALKPQESIARLLSALLPLAEKVVARRPRHFHKNGAEIYLLTEGTFSLYRRGDNLQLSMAKAPHIFGLAELILPVGDTTYVKFAADSDVFVVSGAKAQALFNQQPALWHDVAKILAFHLHFTSWRDLHLLNDSAYDSIRGKLLELQKHDEDFRRDNTILSYIQATTKLSRSTVLRVLKDLSDGGYIETQRGKLLNIVHLPLRY
ncbi:helix-turn-helix domain-containing protein [[Enterobacter] lignolyticus]|uniref:IprA winged helix-turn-helix domain-containing protein n=1 Tax=[Enterobacter] lignolyticus TaxID=1334193 RepID=A0A806X6V5_9ENTR|nr:helix-turn-helix domain-containing protein [[Enterobacter] lignolyticus]ALR75273.1 hypothetical protein AO703_02820 [[Enterobacter] lignolyticus]